MVEVRLEAIEDVVSSMGDCFVSMRIGDTQKLSRLTKSRTYTFPKGDERGIGKIEVLKRIGSCVVDVDPSNTGLRSVTVDCASVGNLGFKVAVADKASAGGKSKKSKEDGIDKPAFTEKARLAKDYLSEHGIEMYLSDAMQELLRVRPDNPREFLAQKLLSGSKSVMLPPIKGSSPAGNAPPMPGKPGKPMEMESPSAQKSRPPPGKVLEPITGSSGKVSAGPARPASVLPVTKYVASHIHVEKTFLKNLCRKFPSKWAPPKGQWYMTTEKTFFSDLYNKFPSKWAAAAAKEKPVAVDRSAWKSNPSVGTWLAKRPINLAGSPGDLAAKAAAKPPKPSQSSVLPVKGYCELNMLKGPIVEKSFNKLYSKHFPSKWAPPKSTFTLYYEEHIVAMPDAGFAKMHAKFPRANKAKGASAPAAAAPAVDYKKLASVGTWLAPSPAAAQAKKAAVAAKDADAKAVADSAWGRNASVGTWLMCTPTQYGRKPGDEVKAQPKGPWYMTTEKTFFNDLYNKFPSKWVESGKGANNQPPKTQPSQGLDWYQQPSVCTWLSRR